MTTWLTPRRAGWIGGVSVVFYVASWTVAGGLWEGYDPAAQAISELFAFGAPVPGRVLLTTSLVVSGAGMVVFARGVNEFLPEVGRVAVVAIILSGLGTGLVAAFPCSPGCPGMGASFSDSPTARRQRTSGRCSSSVAGGPMGGC